MSSPDTSLISIDGVLKTSDAGAVIYTVDTDIVDVTTILKKILDAGYEGEIEVLSPSLEDVLVKLYKE